MSCSSAETTAWLEARIAKTRALIEAYEDALLAFTTTNVQSYSLDTGQTRETVTRADSGRLYVTLGELENRLRVLEARLCGNGVVRVIPGW